MLWGLQWIYERRKSFHLIRPAGHGYTYLCECGVKNRINRKTTSSLQFYPESHHSPVSFNIHLNFIKWISYIFRKWNVWTYVSRSTYVQEEHTNIKKSSSKATSIISKNSLCKYYVLAMHKIFNWGIFKMKLNSRFWGWNWG